MRPADHQRIKDYLDAHFGPAEMETIYWIPLEPSLYSVDQRKHEECHPLYLAVHLTFEAVALELLVRTKNRIRCDCIRYADQAQMQWATGFIDAIFEKLEIINCAACPRVTEKNPC